jgi:hypothetical protein
MRWRHVHCYIHASSEGRPGDAPQRIPSRRSRFVREIYTTPSWLVSFVAESTLLPLTMPSSRPKIFETRPTLT